MTRRAGLAGAFAALLVSWAGPALAASPFADWAAVVVAGDYHGSGGGPTEAFDNARRDVSRELQRIGFAPDNLRTFSVRPDRYKDRPLKSEPAIIYQALGELAGKAKSGCLLYFTSHGAPQGVIIDQQILSPGILGRMLDATCATRPTIVIMSACFSGVFVRPLAAPNRMILTAARPDRTSFGCGEGSVYPFFDDCLLKTSRLSRDFAALASAVKSCVALREIEEGMKPPSEPQVWIGPELRPMLPLYAFPSGPPGAD
ncbi:C13 family peptidase [Phenylobacterium sp.]|uniref:C13 family peptidase n=1 Tax=Phenylobacterium sp. TaxID=1871053 RepID=UPI002734FBFA|nr:C13 family peptidase [Phenylobacterium sp.]MDP3855357.1 C13 family peptidase [Phenylobacterium sp.]